MIERTVPCKWCGTPTLATALKTCNGCWELETRIERNPRLAIKMLQSKGLLLDVCETETEVQDGEDVESRVECRVGAALVPASQDEVDNASDETSVSDTLPCGHSVDNLVQDENTDEVYCSLCMLELLR